MFQWFVANYTYQISLADTEAGIVNVISSTSSLFTLVLAAIFPSNLGDRFTLTKLVAVCISLSGLVSICQIFKHLILHKTLKGNKIEILCHKRLYSGQTVNKLFALFIYYLVTY